MNQPCRMHVFLGLVALCLSAGACRGPTDAKACVAVDGVRDPASPLMMVMFQPDVDAVALTDSLARKYSFTPRVVWAAIKGFAAEMSPTAIQGVSCEPSVHSMSWDTRLELF